MVEAFGDSRVVYYAFTRKKCLDRGKGVNGKLLFGFLNEYSYLSLHGTHEDKEISSYELDLTYGFFIYCYALKIACQ